MRQHHLKRMEVILDELRRILVESQTGQPLQYIKAFEKTIEGMMIVRGMMISALAKKK